MKAKPSIAQPDAGFTRGELLVTMAVVAVLVSLLLAALSIARNAAKRTVCRNNTKQLTVAWEMYSTEHGDRLAPNLNDAETRAKRANWVNNVMSWGLDPDNTNLALITQAKLGSYTVRDTRAYQCPSDQYLSAKQKQAGWTRRTRSYAMNAFLGNPTVLMNGNQIEHENFVHMLQRSQVAQPSMIFVFADEHPDHLNDGNFFMHPEQAPNLSHWHDLPSSLHRGTGILSFADGHVETRKWQFTSSRRKVEYVAKGVPPDVGYATHEMEDVRWLAVRATREK